MILDMHMYKFSQDKLLQSSALDRMIGGAVTVGAPVEGQLNGYSRSSAANFNYYQGSDNLIVNASTTPTASEILLYSRGNPSTSRQDCTLKSYHIGSAINLATLETLQDQLIADVEAIEAYLSPLGFLYFRPDGQSLFLQP